MVEWKAFDPKCTADLLCDLEQFKPPFINSLYLCFFLCKVEITGSFFWGPNGASLGWEEGSVKQWAGLVGAAIWPTWGTTGDSGGAAELCTVSLELRFPDQGVPGSRTTSGF